MGTFGTYKADANGLVIAKADMPISSPDRDNHLA
jgi:hypothetical protein